MKSDLSMPVNALMWAQRPSWRLHGFRIFMGVFAFFVLYWYVYHPDGTPTFIIAIGDNIGNTVRADAYYNTGMKFGEFAAVSFDAMAAIGTWAVSGKTFSGTGIAVSADPDFTFSSRLSMSGQISPEYRMVGNYTTVVVSNCSVSNGTYKGYGSQIDYNNLDDGRAIRLMATNGQYAGVFDLYR